MVGPDVGILMWQDESPRPLAEMLNRHGNGLGSSRAGSEIGRLTSADRQRCQLDGQPGPGVILVDQEIDVPHVELCLGGRSSLRGFE